MKNKINKIILSSLCLLLTSCSNTNVEIINKEYDENDIILKNFTVKDSKECAKAYLNFREKTNDFTFYGVDIYYFLGKYHETANVCIMYSFFNGDMYEGSGDYVYNYQFGKYTVDWLLDKNKCDMNRIPVYVENNKAMFIQDAYLKGLLNDSDVDSIYDIWTNKLDEYAVFIRYEGDI